jgi:hypothetical protein
MGFALAHTKQALVHHLEGVGLQGGTQEEQPVFRGRQGTVLIDGKLAGGPQFPIEAPRHHRGVERGFKGRD